MLAVYQLAVPTPYDVGPINVYLIKNHPITLIDVGPATKKAKRFLRESLVSLGVDMKDIKRIIITHAHPDHCGLVQEIVGSNPSATVFIHELEKKKIQGEQVQYMDLLPLLLETGIPEDILYGIVDNGDKVTRDSYKNVKYVGLKGGENIVFDGGLLKVIHLPGHSPGHICLYDPKQRHFFAGDFLLAQITPNPVMEPDPENKGQRLPTLKQYLKGLDYVETLDISMVCPGHGGIFSDYKGVINTGRRHHQRQLDQIMQQLKGQTLNTFQISKKIYPQLQGWEVFLGLSEIQAHLDFLAGYKKIESYKKQGVAYYTLRG